MWNFLIFFCLGGYFALLIFLCIFVRKCLDLQRDVDDLKDKLFVLEVCIGDFASDSCRCSPGGVLADPEDPEVR